MEVGISKDDYWPWYSVKQDKDRGDVVIEVSDEFMVNYANAMQRVREMQEILADKYAQGREV